MVSVPPVNDCTTEKLISIIFPTWAKYDTVDNEIPLASSATNSSKAKSLMDNLIS